MRAAHESAFEHFVATRSDDLLRLAVLLAADRGHAEDLVQTALVKAYRRWRRISGADPYPTGRAPAADARGPQPGRTAPR